MWYDAAPEFRKDSGLCGAGRKRQGWQKYLWDFRIMKVIKGRNE